MERAAFTLQATSIKQEIVKYLRLTRILVLIVLVFPRFVVIAFTLGLPLPDLHLRHLDRTIVEDILECFLVQLLELVRELPLKLVGILWLDHESNRRVR